MSNRSTAQASIDPESPSHVIGLNAQRAVVAAKLTGEEACLFAFKHHGVVRPCLVSSACITSSSYWSKKLL